MTSLPGTNRGNRLDKVEPLDEEEVEDVVTALPKLQCSSADLNMGSSGAHANMRSSNVSVCTAKSSVQSLDGSLNFVDLPDTPLKHHSGEQSSWAGNGATCGFQDLVALQFAEMERMITEGHRHVLQLLGKSGAEHTLHPKESTGPHALAPLKLAPKHQAGSLRMHNGLPSLHGDHHDSHLHVPGTCAAAPSFPKRDMMSQATLLHSETKMITSFELLPTWSTKVQDHITKAALAGTKLDDGGGSMVQKLLASRNSGESCDVETPINKLLRTTHVDEFLGRWNVQKVIIHPCSFKRAVWDVTSLMLVVYDIAVLPLQFFEPKDNTFSSLMSWVTRVFWSIDLPMTFFTGYLLSDGFIMMRVKNIAIHYFKTWFVLDIGLVSCDWAEFIIAVVLENSNSKAGDATGLGRLGKAGRVVRILRMIRLLRMARMREIIRLFTFRMTSEKLTIMADIAKCLASIIAVAHLLACLWYGICNTDHLNADSWILQSGANDEPMGYKYVLSLHWSLSQFQGGMDEFRASTFSERAFTVVVFLFAFMMAAIVVSGLTSSMTRLHILTSHQSRQISILRRYLIQNGISDKLSLRVQRNALHAISEQQRLMAESKVELLQAISDPLRVELHFEMYGPVLEVHPFFEAYMQACPHVMHHICHQAMSTLLVSHGDVIFNIGEIPENPRMYIVCNGHFEYLSAFNDMTLLYAKDFLSEAALWTHWMHRGALTAAMDGRLCLMNCKRFQEIVRQFDHPEFDPRSYAIEYVKTLNNKTEQGSPITDLPLGSEAQLKDSAALRKRSKVLMFTKLLRRTRQQANLMSNSILPTGGQMLDKVGGRRQSVLFGNNKSPAMARGASKLIRFESTTENQASGPGHLPKAHSKAGGELSTSLSPVPSESLG